MSYRIGIIGVGVGSIVGGLLTKAGHDVTLIDQWPEHVEAMKKVGGYVSEQGRQVGVATPFNDKIVELITRVPPGTLKPDPKNLEPLVAMLPR
jgi:ketopantoate reductase